MGAAANCRPPSAPFFFYYPFFPLLPSLRGRPARSSALRLCRSNHFSPLLPSPLQPQPPPPPISGTAICIAARPLPPPLPLRPPSQPRGVRQRSGGSAGAHLAAAAPTRAALYPPSVHGPCSTPSALRTPPFCSATPVLCTPFYFAPFPCFALHFASYPLLLVILGSLHNPYLHSLCPAPLSALHLPSALHPPALEPPPPLLHIPSSLHLLVLCTPFACSPMFVCTPLAFTPLLCTPLPHPLHPTLCTPFAFHPPCIAPPSLCNPLLCILPCISLHPQFYMPLHPPLLCTPFALHPTAPPCTVSLLLAPSLVWHPAALHPLLHCTPLFAPPRAAPSGAVLSGAHCTRSPRNSPDSIPERISWLCAP